MTKRIVHLTRHPAGAEEVADLQLIYGADVEIVEVPDHWETREELQRIVNEHQPDVLSVVAGIDQYPLLTSLGIEVIRAKMARSLDGTGMVSRQFAYHER